MADYAGAYTGSEIDAAIADMTNALIKTDASSTLDGTLILEDGSPAASEAHVAAQSGSNIAGVVFEFAGPIANIPTGALPCDGSILSSAGYVLLYNAIGNYWNFTAGASDPGAGNFRVPKMNGGYFAKGGDTSTLGVFEGGTNKTHTHSLQGHTHGSWHNHTANHDHTGNTTGNYPYKMETDYRTGLDQGDSGNFPSGWSVWRFTGDGTSGSGNQTGIGIRMAGSNAITVDNENVTTSGPSANTTEGPSTSSTGGEGSTAVKPNNVGIIYCIWTGQ